MWVLGNPTLVLILARLALDLLNVSSAPKTSAKQMSFPDYTAGMQVFKKGADLGTGEVAQ